MAKYQVLAPLIQLKLKDQAGAWVIRQFGAGTLLDRDEIEFDEANFQSHLDSGQVVDEGAPVAEVFAVPAGTPLPGKPPNVAVTEAGLAGQPLPPLSADLLRAAEIEATGDEPYAVESTATDDDAGTSPGGKPRGNASEAAWRDYHVAQLRAQGVDEQAAREEAAGLSRDDLRAQYR